MSDKDKKDKILEAIGVLWRKYPDLRFGQFILNAFHGMNDIYYANDKYVVYLSYRNVYIL